MNWLKSMRQWLTSTFSRRQSTSKVKQLLKPQRIIHEFKESILMAENIRFEAAKNFMVGEHLYCLDFGYVHAEMYPWRWTPEGDLRRMMAATYWLTSKTKKFQLSFMAQAVIFVDKIPKEIEARVQLMEDKTLNMESTYCHLLEDTIGPGQSLPAKSRGRFTILKIEDINDEGRNHERDQGKQKGSSNTLSPKEGDLARVSVDT